MENEKILKQMVEIKRCERTAAETLQQIETLEIDIIWNNIYMGLEKTEEGVKELRNRNKRLKKSLAKFKEEYRYNKFCIKQEKDLLKWMEQQG